MAALVNEQAYKYAVKNAFLHEGKADAGSLIGKLKALNPEMDVKEIAKIAKDTVSEVNEMSPEEISSEYERLEKEEGFELKPREKEPGLKELEWFKEGKERCVTRFAPNPNGPFHLGNARAAVLSHEYARKYDGKFLLRFDDTDPKVKKPIPNAEKIFKEDLGWLGCKVDETFFASDRLSIYFDFMRKLIDAGHAYVCTCSSEEWRKKISAGTACGCRELEAKETMERFEKMMRHEFKEGGAVLKIKTDLKHKDPSIRDWWAAKIVDNPEHPRKGKDFHVWPSYNFASAIDDHELGVTLIIRGQEHAQNETKQRFLYNYFGWIYPHAIYTGRLKLQKAVLSTSKIRKGIEEGIYIGWDDPRLGTIKALRRRGFDARALKDALIDLGIKSNDATIEWDSLAALNRKYAEPVAEKIAFFKNPVRLDVVFAQEKTIEIDGQEVELFEGEQNFIVEREQLQQFKLGEVFRLREVYNVRLNELTEFRAIAEFVSDVPIKKNVIPWLLDGLGVDVIVMMPSAKQHGGMAEQKILSKKIGDLCYFERLGFVRIDDKGAGRIIAWFTHK